LFGALQALEERPPSHWKVEERCFQNGGLVDLGKLRQDVRQGTKAGREVESAAHERVIQRRNSEPAGNDAVLKAPGVEDDQDKVAFDQAGDPAP
jgi:hypothetical protein